MNIKSAILITMLPFCAMARPPVLELGTVSCSSPSRDYASVEMGLKNLHNKTITKAKIQFNILDSKGKLVSSDYWTFNGIREGKTVVNRLGAIDSITCKEIGLFELTNVTCEIAGDSNKYDCYDVTAVSNGPIKLKK
jgi:hypothetical protein